MTRLVFPAPLIERVRAAISASPLETCAIFLTCPAIGGRILVRDGATVPERAYQIRTTENAVLNAAFVFEVARRAREEQSGIVFAHSHPRREQGSDFSHTDDAGEAALAGYLKARLPGHDHIALLIGRQRMNARRLGAGGAISIAECGSQMRFACLDADAASDPYTEIFDRQVRAFGAAGQRVLNRIRVAIVGLGGTGSITALQLAYLGVRDFLLIEPQSLETTNRNRVVGSKPGDVGMGKADIARRQILDISPSATVETDTSAKGVLDADCLQGLRTVDFIFLCTDSHASRAALCKLCYQHLIPGIDIGVAIDAGSGAISAITGRTQMLAPGLPCLLCTSSINPDAIRKELMSPEQKAADPYFSRGGEPQPAVISLNATICSLAITMFLAAVAGIPAEARYQRYDGIKGVVRHVVGSADPSCLYCSTGGALGRGDSRPTSFP